MSSTESASNMIIETPTNPTTKPQQRDNFASMKETIKVSPSITALKTELSIACKLSLSGITNFVTGYEDASIVDVVLQQCFESQYLYNQSINISAVELEKGEPKKGNAIKWLDDLIFGSVDINIHDGSPIENPQHGCFVRRPNGFVNRREVIGQKALDKQLVIRDVDLSMEFCTASGKITRQALPLFEKFRNPQVKKGCRILLVTRKPVIFPFKIRSVYMPKIDDVLAQDVINSFVALYTKSQYTININENQNKELLSLLKGHTYMEAGDHLGYAFSRSNIKGERKIDISKVIEEIKSLAGKNTAFTGGK